VWCVTVRDLAPDHGRLAIDRMRTREETFAAALAAGERMGGVAGELILTQTRQLIGDAKQTPQRDVLLPRLKAIRELAGDLEAQTRVGRWLATTLWGDLPPACRVEFLAGESVRSVVDQLAVRLKAVDATVAVTDHGGWVYCDEDWFRTAVHGMLAHAAAAVKGGPIGVKLNRLPCAPGQREGNLEVSVVDAGPLLSPAQMTALGNPFGDLTPAPLLPAEDGEGFLPGLLVAAKLAAALGGELGFDSTPSGRLVIRLVVPTRLPDNTDLPPTDRADLPTTAADVGAAEELCFGWKLGTAG
jgi:signal transduction histidine kinase